MNNSRQKNICNGPLAESINVNNDETMIQQGLRAPLQQPSNLIPSSQWKLTDQQILNLKEEGITVKKGTTEAEALKLLKKKHRA